MISAPQAIEHCFTQGWTDGLPVVPCGQEQLDAMLAGVDRDPGDVLLEMPQLNRAVTMRLAAINAVMAGCLPEYFPVVVAAWDSLRGGGLRPQGDLAEHHRDGAPCCWSTGRCGEQIGINSRGNLFGPGFRANATIGRAIRLTAMNALGLRPHELDQATQATPAKYTCCIGENEEESPWTPLHVDFGLAPEDSAVTAMTMRSTVHIEARHTAVPEQLLHDIAGHRVPDRGAAAPERQRLRGARPGACAPAGRRRLDQARRLGLPARAVVPVPRRTGPRRARARCRRRAAGAWPGTIPTRSSTPAPIPPGTACTR